MNAEQFQSADRLVAAVHEYGYACVQAATPGNGQCAPKAYASELFEDITREVYRLHSSYCRTHGVRNDEHVGGCA